jgi:hypothetical protein
MRLWPNSSTRASGPIQGSAAVNMSQVQAVAVTNADTGQELAYLQV